MRRSRLTRADQKLGSLVSVSLMDAQAGLRRIGLQVKGGGLCRPLLLVGQPSEAGSEGVGYAELHDDLAVVQGLFSLDTRVSPLLPIAALRIRQKIIGPANDESPRESIGLATISRSNISVYLAVTDLQSIRQFEVTSIDT